MIQPFNVKQEVSCRDGVWELQLPRVLVDALAPTFHQNVVLCLFVRLDFDCDPVLGHGQRRRVNGLKRHSPFHFLELELFCFLIEVCLYVDHPQEG